MASPSSSLQQEGPKVYIAYSRRDRRWVEEFRDACMKADVGMTLFYDLDIEAGRDWDQELRRNLAASDVVMFFLSPRALESKYMWSVEVPYAVDQVVQGRKYFVMPVLLEDCDWQSRRLGRFMAFPRDGRPIMSVPERGALWASLIAELWRLLHGEAGRHMPEAAASSPPLPAGPDRLRFALYAVLDQPSESGLLEQMEPTELNAHWQRLAHGASSTAQALEAMAGRHGAGMQPNLLWAAWMATVRPAKLSE